MGECLEAGPPGRGLRRRFPVVRGWGNRRSQHGGDGRDGPERRTGGGSARRGVWRVQALGQAMRLSRPKLGMAARTASSAKRMVRAGGASEPEGRQDGGEAWRRLVTPQRFCTEAPRPRSVSTSWELKDVDGQDRSGPEQGQSCGRKSVVGSGPVCASSLRGILQAHSSVTPGLTQS